MLKTRLCLCRLTFPALALLVSSLAKASNIPAFHLTLEDHVFTPSKVVVPSNVKVKLIITNKDNSAEEFDSFDLNRERVVFAGKQATIFIGPLPPGQYTFFGEFHPESAQGVVIAQESKP